MAVVKSRLNHNITFCKDTGRQKVRIVRDGTEYFLGRFDTKEEARVARDAFLLTIDEPAPQVVDAKPPATAPVPPARDPDRYITYMKRDNTWRLKVTRNYTTLMKRYLTIEEARAARDEFEERITMTPRAEELWRAYWAIKPSKRPSVSAQVQAMTDCGLPVAIVLATAR